MNRRYLLYKEEVNGRHERPVYNRQRLVSLGAIEDDNDGDTYDEYCVGINICIILCLSPKICYR